MKKNSQRTLLLASIAALFAGAIVFGSAGCQLVADFDRSIIEAGEGGSDSSTPDGSTPDATPDARPDATPDSGADADGAADGGDGDAGDADADV